MLLTAAARLPCDFQWIERIFSLSNAAHRRCAAPLRLSVDRKNLFANEPRSGGKDDTSALCAREPLAADRTLLGRSDVLLHVLVDEQPLLLQVGRRARDRVHVAVVRRIALLD